MDDRWRTPRDGKSSCCLWQGLLKRILKCDYLLVMYRINMLHYVECPLWRLLILSWSVRPKKKIGVFPIDRPTLKFYRNVYGSKHLSNVQGNEENCLKSETNTETETNFQILPIYFFFGIKNVRVGGKILGSVDRSETHLFFFWA
jgi:hypothetical protein